MKTILFADDTFLVQSDYNLGKLENSVNCEMTKVMGWLTHRRTGKHFTGGGRKHFAL